MALPPTLTRQSGASHCTRTQGLGAPPIWNGQPAITKLSSVRAIGAAAALARELVPIVWKDEWAAMKPFLLD